MYYDHVVLGAGISGLTLASELKAQGKKALILEAQAHAGGVLKSVSSEEFLWDRAAHTLAVDPEITNFFEKHGLAHLLVETSSAAKIRQLCIDDRIYEISNNPLKILTSEFLSLGAKIKLLRSLFKKPILLSNPTVREFFNYHFGTEITKNIVSAVFSGIYAGDIELLEMNSVMSKVFKIERKHGSVIRGLMKESRNTPKRAIKGIKGGAEQLSLQLAKSLDIEYDCKVNSITKTNQGWEITAKDKKIECKKLYSTIPAYALAKIDGFLPKEIKDKLASIAYAPIILAHVAFPNIAKNEASAAFGFLCNQYQYPHFKGAIYNSELFPERVPKGFESYTLFVKPNEDQLDDQEQITQVIQKAIAKFKSVTNQGLAPSKLITTVWKKGIPQFNKPYKSIKEDLLSFSEDINGFYLSGSFISGVSVPDCIKFNVNLATI